MSKCPHPAPWSLHVGEDYVAILDATNITVLETQELETATVQRIVDAVNAANQGAEPHAKCSKCGDTRVESPSWVSLRTGLIQDSYNDDTWCPACEETGLGIEFGYDSPRKAPA